MNPELSIFAARLREFIGFCGDESLKSLPAAELQKHFDAEFNAMALVLFGLQFRNNPAYQKICTARGITPNDISRWTQNPAVPTAAFKELEMTSLSSQERTTVFYSSGTTEQRPSRHFHCADSLATYEASLWAWFLEHLQSPVANLQLAILTPPPAQAPHSSLVHMFEVVRAKHSQPASAFLGRVEVDGAWSLNLDATLAALQSAIKQQQSLLLLGTAFSFVHLLDFLAEQNRRFMLPAGSRVMETGGYKNRSRQMSKGELHTLISERLGVPAENILCEYGMSELSSQAYDSPHLDPQASRRFRFPPWARAQIISPETGREVADGETGLVRVFDLANVYSVMAIQTEDLAVRRGDGFELLGRAIAAEPRGCSLLTV